MPTPGPRHAAGRVGERLGNLCRLITEAHRGTREGPGARRRSRPRCRSMSSSEHTEGLVCLSGCARDGAVAGSWERGRSGRRELLARRLLRAFGPERFRIELQRPLWRRDRSRNRWLDLAGRAARRRRRGDRRCPRPRALPPAPLQDALVAVRLGATLDETEALRRGNSTSVLLSPAASGDPLRRSPRGGRRERRRLAERLRFDLTRELGYSYPGAEDQAPTPPCRALPPARLTHRYEGTASSRRGRAAPGGGAGADPGAAASPASSCSTTTCSSSPARSLPRSAGPDSARRLLPPGRGRGSSVSSLVCYLTGLSHIDPVPNDLFLGRFLNEELTEVPDIDLDFPRDIREKLIPRVARALRPRAIGAGRLLRHLPGARRDPRPRQGAGAAPRARSSASPGSVDVYEASRRCLGADRGGAGQAARPLAALAGAGRAAAGDRRACRATSPSTPGAW